MKLLFVLALVVCLAAVAAEEGITVDTPGASMSSRYKCIYKSLLDSDSIGIYGGAWSNQDGTGYPKNKAVILSGGTMSGLITPDFQLRVKYGTTGNHWIYIRDLDTGNNIDYINTEVQNYGTSCSNIDDTPPSSYASNGNPP